MGRIVVHAVGNMPSDVVAALCERLREKMPSERVEVGPPFVFPDYAFNPRRRQYHADAIVAHLRTGRPADDTTDLGITDVDLYTLDFDFVFGAAGAGGGVAVVSLYRLRPEFYGQPKDPRVLQERVLRESLHEIGHARGLGHCADPRCVMYPSRSVVDIDHKHQWPCTSRVNK